MKIRFYTTLERCIAGEFLFSFLVCFLFYFLIFVLNQLLLMAKDILAKGIPVTSVLLLVLYSLPSIVTLTAPFATLTGALMAYGRFSSDNEIMAMRSAGFRRIVIFRPVLVLGVLFAFLSFGVNDVLLPAGTRAFQRLWLELSLTYAGLELEPYSVRTFEQSVLVTGAIDDEGIHPLLIIERDNSGNQSTLTALRASSEARSGKLPGFRMFDVFSLTPDAREEDRWSWTTAGLMEYRLSSGEADILAQQSGPANMRTAAVRDVIREKSGIHSERLESHAREINRTRWRLRLNYSRSARRESGGRNPELEAAIRRDSAELERLIAEVPRDHSLQVWKLEYYQKFAIPFACIPFVILAFPLGLSARRSGRAVGFFIGLLLTSFYWALLVLGRSLGLRTDFSPFTAMILPNILLLILGILLYLRRSRV